MADSEKDPDTYPFAVFYTQGGGLVKEISVSPLVYVFVEAPDRCPSLHVGDTMPAEWDIIPANLEAKKILQDEQFGGD